MEQIIRQIVQRMDRMESQIQTLAINIEKELARQDGEHKKAAQAVATLAKGLQSTRVVVAQLTAQLAQQPARPQQPIARHRLPAPPAPTQRPRLVQPAPEEFVPDEEDFSEDNG